MTVWGQGLGNYRQEPRLTGDGGVVWQPAARRSHDEKVLAPLAQPFSPNGGLKMLKGNLGRAVIKVSAVKPERHIIEAPAVIFHSQDALMAAFKAGELEKDFVELGRASCRERVVQDV